VDGRTIILRSAYKWYHNQGTVGFARWACAMGMAGMCRVRTTEYTRGAQRRVNRKGEIDAVVVLTVILIVVGGESAGRRRSEIHICHPRARSFGPNILHELCKRRIRHCHGFTDDGCAEQVPAWTHESDSVRYTRVIENCTSPRVRYIDS
jgi:hypothetical protein